MTAADTLLEFHVPSTKFAYFLGCFERRVTIYSQQVRALNLADALIGGDVITEGARIAVIGGGVAGATFAAALALGGAKAKEIVLFEKKNDLLHLQQSGRDRYIHPHLYDWPAEHASQSQAGLPILDWAAGSAAAVAEQILDSFNNVVSDYRTLQVRTGCTVESVNPMPRSGCKVSTDGSHNGTIFDIVVFAIGFGYERLVSEHVPSYWASSILQSIIPSPASTHQFFVSGNGDGGLVDFAMAVLGQAHQNIVKAVTEFPGLDDVRRELMKIEEEAWLAGPEFDLLAQYENRITLPAAMPLRLYEQFRPNDSFILHTRAEKLFRKDTSILNRFVVFSLIQADQEQSKIRVICGKDFHNGQVPLTGPIQLVGEEIFSPDYRFLRLGPDQQTVLQPVQDLANSFIAAKQLESGGYRPATPKLNDSAEERYKLFAKKTFFKEATVAQDQHNVVTSPVSIGAEAVVQQELAARAKQNLDRTPTDFITAQNNVSSSISRTSSWSYAVNSGYSNISYPRGQNPACMPILEAKGASADKQEASQAGRNISIRQSDQSSGAPTINREIIQARVNDLCRWIRDAIKTLELNTAFRQANELEETLIAHEAFLSAECRRACYSLLVEVELKRPDSPGSDKLDRAKQFLNRAQNV
jgi:hypothetical protein